MWLVVQSEVAGELIPGAELRPCREMADEVSLVFCSFCLEFTPPALIFVLLLAVVTRCGRKFGLLGLVHSYGNTENTSL